MATATPDPYFPEMSPEEFSAHLAAGESVTLDTTGLRSVILPFDDSGFDPKAWDEHWLDDDLSD